MASFNYQEAKKCRAIKPALLKDYLLDDLSSCSSNGFKSFPRRQCCITVRFLVDNDLKSKPKLKPKTSVSPRKQSFHKTRQTAATTSVFQKASEVVLNTVKLLAIHNRSSLNLKSGFLSRSFSKKVFKRTLWKKKNVDGQIQESDIHRWKTFHNLIADFPDTPPYCTLTTIIATQNGTSTTPPVTITITPPTTTTTTTTSTTSTDSKNSSKSSSWSENEFTSEVRSGGSSIADTADKEKDWVIAKDEKEQFSPVSLLESPFHGEDGDDTSPTDADSVLSKTKYDTSWHGVLQINNMVELLSLIGAKKRVIKWHGRFKTLADMEPINLDSRLAALSEIDNNELVENIASNLDAEKAQKMLEHVKSRVETKSTFCADNLLQDFFMDSFDESQSNHGLKVEEVCYLTGEGKGMGFDWRVEESRKWYIKDMEKDGRWKHVDEDERTYLVKEIEGGIWGCLLNELMSELKVD